MSHNVSSWETKTLEDLVIPVASLFKHPRKDWHPERENNDDGTVTFVIGEGSSVTGKIVDGHVLVTEIEASGEGSGTALDWIIEPALEDSLGTLVAARVWEGGESIDRLTVIDGNILTEEINL